MIPAALFAASWPTAVSADDAPVRVTADNFTRAEPDTYFAKFVAEGACGKFQHEREPAK